MTSSAFEAFAVRIFRGQIIMGTGILVSREHVLTCAHVVARALGLPDSVETCPVNLVELDFPLLAPGRRVAAHAVKWHPLNSEPGDIAVLQVDGDLPNGCHAPSVVLMDDYWGHEFRCFGFPEGRDNGAWAEGVVRDQQARGLVQIDGNDERGYQIAGGFSGGAVWLEDRRGIIGMISLAETAEGLRVAFMIPAETLLNVLPEGAHALVYRARTRLIGSVQGDTADTYLQTKLLNGGASPQIVNGARHLRAFASAREYEYLAADLDGDAADLEDVRFRLRIRHDALLAIHAEKEKPAVLTWTATIDQLAAQAAVIDTRNLFGQDPDLLLGELCEMTDQCEIDWGQAHA